VLNKAGCPEQLEQSNMRGYHGGHYQITVFWDVTPCGLENFPKILEKHVVCIFMVEI